MTMDNFDADDWFDEDGQPRDAAEFAEFLGIVLNLESAQPDREADEKFLREMLPRLRAEGKHAHARSLIDDFVQKHGKPT